jgi:hypothetical protein
MLLEITSVPSVYDWDTYLRSRLDTWDSLVAYFCATLERPIGRKDQAPMVGPYRLAANAPARTLRYVEAVTLAIFDVDKRPDGSPLTVEDIQDAEHRLAQADVAHIWYTTYSHDPKAGRVSYRLVMPLAGPIAPSHWKGFRASVAARYGIPLVDRESSDASHCFYLPTKGAVVTARPGAPLSTAGYSESEIRSVAVAPAHEPTMAELFYDPPEAQSLEDLKLELTRAAKGYRRSGDAELADYLEACCSGRALGDSARNPKTARLCWALVQQLHPQQLRTYHALLHASVRQMQSDGSSLRDTDVTRMLKGAARKWHQAKGDREEFERRLSEYQKRNEDLKHNAPVVRTSKWW